MKRYLMKATNALAADGTSLRDVIISVKFKEYSPVFALKGSGPQGASASQVSVIL
jgi:hypothetical protein